MSDEPRETTPENPFNSMDVVALELHEMYLHLQRAGFSRKEALYIVSIAVSEGVMLPRFSFNDYEFNDEDDGEDFTNDGDDPAPNLG